MKRCGLLFCLLLPLTLLQGADITTTKGKTYYNYTVASYSAEGLTILHRQGAVMIPLEEWPEDRREEIKKYVAKIEKRRKAISKRPDLTTKTGAVLRKYKILRFSESGAHISHWGGVTIVKVEELPDGMIIRGGALHGAEVSSFGDHRIAMALAVAGLAAEGETVIDRAESASVTYPDFIRDFQNIGADFTVL